MLPYALMIYSVHLVSYFSAQVTTCHVLSVSTQVTTCRVLSVSIGPIYSTYDKLI